MKTKAATISLSLILCMAFIISCEKEEGENEKKISRYNETESHNMGQNCMECHKSGGSGEGWFNLAGTVYDEALANPYPNATLKLYTQPNGGGELKYTLEVDGKGNFFTTETIDFGTGLYPSVKGNSQTRNMVSAINNGKCNSCHGSSTDRIWTK